jgi:hypothetical protein
MNLAVSKTRSTTTLSWRILLESQADGQVLGWVAEWPECRVVAESEDAAIEQLEILFDERLNRVKVLQVPAQSEMDDRVQKIMSLPGIDKDDPNFIAIMAEMRAERELDDDNPAYTINW